MVAITFVSLLLVLCVVYGRTIIRTKQWGRRRHPEERVKCSLLHVAGRKLVN